MKYHLYPIIILLFIAGLTRYFYLVNGPDLFISADTYGYYETGQKLINEGIPVNDSRPPLYSFLLVLPALLNGRPDTFVLSGLFFRDMKWIVIFQSLLGLTSLIFIYKIALFLKLPTKAAFLITSFSAFNIMVFGMERILMTETVTVFLLLFLAYTVLILFKKYSLGRSLLIWLILSLLFLTKPLYFLLPLPIFALIIYRFKKRQVFYHSLILLLLFGMTVFSYSLLNYKYNQYRGFSRVGDLALLGKILVQKLDISPAKNNYYYPFLKKYMEQNREPQPFRFMETTAPLYWQDREKMNSLTPLVKTVILANFPQYFLKSLAEIPVALVETNDLVIHNFPFNYLFRFYRALQYLSFLIFPAAFLILNKFLKKTSKENCTWFSILLLPFYQIMLTVFIDYGEYGRILSVTQPFSYLLVLYFLMMVKGKFRKNYQ